MSFDLAQVVRPAVRALAAYPAPRPPGPRQVKLDANESPFALGGPTGGLLAAELAKALADVDLHRYPDPDAGELRAMLAADLGIGAEQLVVTNGSDEAIQLREIVAGGPVLIPVPTFSMYELPGHALGLEVGSVPLTATFDLDGPAFHAALERVRPRLVFLAWPNNPTGRLFEEPAVEDVVRACAGERCQALVAVDEAYADYSGRSFLDRLDRYPNLVILRTLSKIGLAGIRLGMLIGSAALTREVNKVRSPYNVNALSQAAARVVLGHRELIRDHTATIVHQRDRLVQALAGLRGIRVYPSDANFLLLRTEGAACEVAEQLLARGIVVRDFSQVPFLERCLRVTVGTPDENAAFLSALSELLSRRRSG